MLVGKNKFKTVHSLSKSDHRWMPQQTEREDEWGFLPTPKLLRLDPNFPSICFKTPILSCFFSLLGWNKGVTDTNWALHFSTRAQQWKGRWIKVNLITVCTLRPERLSAFYLLPWKIHSFPARQLTLHKPLIPLALYHTHMKEIRLQRLHNSHLRNPPNSKSAAAICLPTWKEPYVSLSSLMGTLKNSVQNMVSEKMVCICKVHKESNIMLRYYTKHYLAFYFWTENSTDQ